MLHPVISRELTPEEIKALYESKLLPDDYGSRIELRDKVRDLRNKYRDDGIDKLAKNIPVKKKRHKDILTRKMRRVMKKQMEMI